MSPFRYVRAIGVLALLGVAKRLERERARETTTVGTRRIPAK